MNTITVAIGLTEEQYATLCHTNRNYSFAPICPDFIVELRSKSDSLPLLPAKMQE